MKEVLNQQIFRKKEVLMEVMCGFSKGKSCKINKLKDKKESVFVKRFSKSKRKY